ncbi:MAG: 2-succinyl-5-enolpyruvyl-6-hydroxy-3-cyclohexene-1-carboxylic-acid synthase, partial [Muribaculaceae bacterium]|nr:2-succinyl-5-enolpyruvyl-6-hydroxy-3-cyclohexene-1-carboxylic-acid synthase [Muribaculaceae bacterium]
TLDRALASLSRLDNVAVMTEAQSNLRLPDTANHVSAIDSTLSAMTETMRQQMLPSTVITFGGSLLSRMVKQWLRDAAAQGLVSHWHIGMSDNAVDCFKCLAKRVMMPPEVFFEGLLTVAEHLYAPSCYGERWRRYAAEALDAKRAFVDNAPWSDLRAMSVIMGTLPPQCNLHLSNGTAVRYAQLFDCGGIRRIDCNRGVSGIDGCTSTAVGASKAYSGTTVLVTGDMSAQYDMGALAVPDIPSSFRIIVLNNGGGGIFRFIKSTSGLDELDRYFVGDVRLPLRELSEGFGFRYYEVTSEDRFRSIEAEFYADSGKPAIMNVITPGGVSAEVL